MSTLLYPMTVSAKVVKTATKVPTLSGVPFNRDAALEAGIHLHWALPDALTAATVLPNKGTKSVVFPAVPDLWLVVRFNPGTSSSTPLAKRTWTAWMVDSVAQTNTPLAKWTPTPRHAGSGVHTFAGVLPDAASVGYGGSGLWDTDPKAHPGGPATFDPAMAAYYPESRKRFGFYDSLGDLAKPTGNVSYLVVGWYSSDAADPLNISTLPDNTLRAWKASTTAMASTFANVTPQVSLSGAAAQAPAWTGSIGVASAQLPTSAQQLALQHVAAQNGSVQAQSKSLADILINFPAPAKLADGSMYMQVAAAGAKLLLPKETVCHGAVVSVPLGGAGTLTPIDTSSVKLYPNVNRALADLSVNAATNGVKDSVMVDGAEMLLADLGSQTDSTGGIIDLPGATHAATFQSVPGKSKVYARIDIEAPASKPMQGGFVLSQDPSVSARAASGYWPLMETRSASVGMSSRISSIPGLQFTQPPSTPTGPSLTDITNFLASTRSAFGAALVTAAANGITLDPRMLRVNDSRSNARSTSLGITPDGSGSDGAGWWIDINDDNALTTLLQTTVGAIVSVPSASNTYELPGPRWYRSWSPQIVLSNLGRSYKFGYDGRFRNDKQVQTRLSGNTLTSLAVGKQPAVFGVDLVLNPQNFNVAGVPPVVQALAREMLLLDPESAGSMAAASGTSTGQAGYSAGINGVLYSRDPRFDSTALHAVSLNGDAPSPLAITPWQDPIDPLLLDSNYSHPHSDMSAWQLQEGDVEMTPASAQIPALPVEAFTERSHVTATVPSVLKSAMLTRTGSDMQGVLAQRQKANSTLTEDAFNQMNVISAPLTQFDSQLVGRGYRLRAGSLRLNKLELLDMFGIARPWNSGIDPASPAVDTTTSFAVSLPPRLPYWGRYTFRLSAADQPSVEADASFGPVCGLLLPDFLDHALEVFDGTGQGLGRLTTDMPIQGDTNGATLNITYTPHPWLDPNPDPLFHIQSNTLKLLVQSLLQQGITVPAGTVTWAETGLSAMLRTIDTIRGTFDPSAKTSAHKVRLVGEPILVMGGRLQFNGTSTEEPADLTHDPALLTAPPSLPVLQVRIGDVTRPDDGVLGLFVAGATPANARFAPVCKDAAAKALVNILSPLGVNLNATQAVTHPFVAGQEAEVSLPANQAVDVVVLADVRNAVYVTCGALPRKKITIPKEFVDAAIKAFEPSFYAGPVLTTVTFDSEKTLLPPPDLAGYSAEFLYQALGSSTFSHTEVPAAIPLGDLPPTRVLLTEGWLRMVPVPPPASQTP